jgi:hypothetical protein
MYKIKEIVRPSFRSVVNSEHHSYHANIFDILTFAIVEKYNMGNYFRVYELLFKKEKEAFTRTRYFEETKEIKISVTKRDEVFCFIRRIIESMSYNPDAELKNAAKILNNVLEPYRYANRKAYQENISQITAFINELEGNETLLKAIKLLNLIRPLEILKTANKSFKELHNERSSKRYLRLTQDTLRQLRPQVDNAFFEVIKFINAIYLVNHEITKEKTIADELGIVIDNINGFTADMMNTISKRKGKKCD